MRTIIFVVLSLAVFNVLPNTDLFAEEVSMKVESIVLPQPDHILQARLTGAEELAEYIEQINAAANDSIQASGGLKPTTGAIVVAVKPRYQAKFWLMSSEYPVPESISKDFHARFDRIRPVAVQFGPIVFAVHFTINGGGKPLVARDTPMPIPQEWETAAKNAKESLLIPDGFLELVWPDKPVSTTSLTVPDGFELQTLDVTQGSILKPKGWFYKFSGNEQSLVWSISKEDPHPNGYRTGLSIQLSPGISRTTSKSAQANAEDLLANLRERGTVIHTCEPEEAGDFTRVCLETKEAIAVSGEKGDYHVLYTVSWSNELDMITVMIFGTPYDDWDKYQNIYAQMKNFVLIGDGVLE